MKNTKTPMKDKETKEEFYRLFKMALNQAVSGEEMRDGEKDGLEELINYVSKLEQEAERRGLLGLFTREELLEVKRCIGITEEETLEEDITWDVDEKVDGLLKLLEEENGKQE